MQDFFLTEFFIKTVCSWVNDSVLVLGTKLEGILSLSEFKCSDAIANWPYEWQQNDGL